MPSLLSWLSLASSTHWMHCGEAVTSSTRQHHRQTPEGVQSSPETPEARTDPAADFGPLYGNLQLGNTPRLWLSEVGYSWEKRFKNHFSLLKSDFSTVFGFDSIKNTSRMRCIPKSYHSPKCTAFSTPTAAVLCQSKVWPTWSAWALVRSSNRTSLGSLALGR